ncbi:MAG TPA: barstar family protein [Aestuariivirga sp.]
MKQIFIIDGNTIENLDGFYEEISSKLPLDGRWGRNLDAFDDILGGGFGTPDGGFIVQWINSEKSREKLGHTETVRVLERRLQTCHPSNMEAVKRAMAVAKEGNGPTIFDDLVEIIRNHGMGGSDAGDGIELYLS